MTQWGVDESMHGCEHAGGPSRGERELASGALPAEGAYRLARLLVVGAYAAASEGAAGRASQAAAELRRSAVATASRLLGATPAAGPLDELERLAHWIEACRDEGRLDPVLASSLLCLRSRLKRALES